MKSLLSWAVLLAAVGFVPLFGGPRYEAALFAGLVGPFWCALAAASEVRRFLEEALSSESGTFQASGASVLNLLVTVAFGHILVMFVVALLHGLRSGFCEPGLGFGLLMLGPGMGMFLGAAWGAVSALLWGGVGFLESRRSRMLIGVTALIPPISAITWGLYHFYDSPSVYAYSPFVGYFAGPLYDTVQYDLERLAGYRTGTILTLVALGAVLQSVRISWGRDGKSRLGLLPRTPQRVVLVLAGALSAVGSLAHAALGEEMGYSSSTAGIRRALGRSLSRERCRVFFPRGVSQSAAALLAEECVGHLTQVEAYFGITGYPGVDVYLFASAGEKRRLMGAATTYIAKPWRNEIYLQPAGFPHQVLGHELAHAVTGSFGEGPFAIAGHLGGLLPDPGRIEGFAEAASPRENSEGTLHEWTAAMRQLELLPRIGSLFQLSFLGAAPANAYSASGSFVDFVRRRHGPEALREWYGGGDLAAISGSSFEQLEKDWHSFLDAVPVPKRVLEIARPRFSRPAVFQRRCPHAVDRLLSESVEICPYQEKKALRLAAEAVSLDPTKKDIELWTHRCAWYAGDAVRSMRTLLQGAARETEYEPSARRAALEFAGDVAWASGRSKEARNAFLEAQKLTFGLGQARNLEVKLWALDQDEGVEKPLRALLVPRPSEKKSPPSFLTEWLMKGPEKELARYLLVRNLDSTGAFDEADDLAFALNPDDLPLESLKLEARKMKLLSACRRGFRTKGSEGLRRALTEYLEAKPHPAGVVEASRIAARCEAALNLSEVKR